MVANYAVLYSKEFRGNELKANRLGYFKTWFGPHITNFDYYPTAAPHRDTVVIMDWENGKDLNAFRLSYLAFVNQDEC